MMRRVSRKAAKRMDECRDFRLMLIHRVGRCEMCGSTMAHVRYKTLNDCLCCHEIARGPNRQKALDQPCAILVVCYKCHSQRLHGGREPWPEARQLAVLKRSRPQDYDLAKYNALVSKGPKHITEADVMEYA